MISLKNINQNNIKEWNTLSPREGQCVEYLLKGLSNKHIAAELHLSQRTIESYIDNMKIKLRCRNKMELIIVLTKHHHPIL